MNEEKAESWIYKLKFQRSYEPKNYRFQLGEKLNAKMDDTIGRWHTETGQENNQSSWKLQLKVDVVCKDHHILS